MPARHAWGVFGPTVWLWECLYSLILKGPPPPGQNYPQSLETLFWSLFCIIFQNLFCRTIGAQKPSKWEPRTDQNHKNLIKTHPQSVPSFGLAKKLHLGGVKPLKLMTVTHFQLFFRKLISLKKSSKWEPKWSRRCPKSQKISKTERSKNIKNFVLQKVD